MTGLNHLNRVEIIAHRGASHEAPENTLAAVNLAWQQGADAVEVDVHRTADNEVIVIHDDSTKRTAGVRRPVAEQTLAELQALDAGSFRGPQWKGEKLPSFAEVLATLPAGRRLFVEVKSGPAILAPMARVLDSGGKDPGQVVIIGFSLETMRQARQMLPGVPMCLLGSIKARTGAGREQQVDEWIFKARSIGMNGLDLEAGPAITAAVVKKVHQAGLKLYVWTVNHARLAVRLSAAGVDGITTNHPGRLRQQLAAVQM